MAISTSSCATCQKVVVQPPVVQQKVTVTQQNIIPDTP